MNRIHPRLHAAPVQSHLNILSSEIRDNDISVTVVRHPSSTAKFKARKAQAPFLKGPIPMAWLSAAAHLPGKAINLAIAIRFMSGMVGWTSIKLNRRLLSDMKISPDACSDGLLRLEQAGLIRVTRKPGQRPLIDIKEIVDGCAPKPARESQPTGVGPVEPGVFS